MEKVAPTSVEVLDYEEIGAATWTLSQMRWGIRPDTYEIAVADVRPGEMNRFTVIDTCYGYDHARNIYDSCVNVDRQRFG